MKQLTWKDSLVVSSRNHKLDSDHQIRYGFIDISKKVRKNGKRQKQPRHLEYFRKYLFFSSRSAFLGFFQEALCVHRTDTIFPGAKFYVFTERFSRSPYFGFGTDTNFPGAPFKLPNRYRFFRGPFFWLPNRYRFSNNTFWLPNIYRFSRIAPF